MRGDDSVDRRQSQSGPPPDLLGGKEGLEDPVANLLIDSNAVVGDGEPDMVSAFGVGVRLAMRVIDDHIFDANQNPRLPVGRRGSVRIFFDLLQQGIARVDAKIHHQLVHLPRIGQYRPKIGRDVDLHPDPPVDRLPEKTRHLIRLPSRDFAVAGRSDFAC
ncbi:MAG: hypothetical protein MPW15_13470 [Candidatus Manganitrophus sp.]|nr:hypothetical protein [Candidatus Manganitrophus sp.]